MATFDFTRRAAFEGGYFDSYRKAGSEHLISDARAQSIGDGVTITGYGLDGRIAPLAFSSQFDEPGLGVADGGARWNGQIDYYWDHANDGRRVSERMVIDFDGAVDDVVLSVGMLGAREGRGADGRVPETGEWIAYDAGGRVVGRGVIDPANSIAGNQGPYGAYGFDIDVGRPIASLAIEARPFGWPDADRDAQDGFGGGDRLYAGKEDRENNSDFGITSISYDRVGGGGDGPPSNADPQARGDAYALDAGGRIAKNVLRNDRDADGDGLSARLVSGPANGEATLGPGGRLTYVPDAGFAGTDRLTYAALDGKGGRDTAEVVLTVRPAKDPVAPKPEPQPPVPGPGGGAVPTDGLVLRLEAVSGVVASGGGAVSAWRDLSGLGNHVTAGGDPTLVAGATPTGAAAIHFDGGGDVLSRSGDLRGLSTGSQDRTVLAVIDYVDVDQVASGIGYGAARRNEAFGLVARPNGDLQVDGWGSGNNHKTRADGIAGGFFVQSAIVADDVLSHYRDDVRIDRQAHVFDTAADLLILGGRLSGGTRSEMKISAVLVYDRALSAAEHDRAVGYLADRYVDGDGDGEGGGGPTPPPPAANAAPVAVDDAFATMAGARVAGRVTANDRDPDGDALSAVLVSGPADGRATLSPDGRFSYLPDDGFAGSDAFVYAVSDGKGGRDTARVAIDVAPAPDAPPAGGTGGGKTFAPGTRMLEDGVGLTALGLDGSAAKVVKKAGGYGVEGGRYGFQIDYDAATGTSETMVVEFARPVRDVTLTLQMMARDERGTMDETGIWSAYDADGALLGTGRLDAGDGRGAGPRDAYAFDLDVDPRGAGIDRLEIEATAYDGGAGARFPGNNSDFQILDVDYLLI